MRYLFLLLLLIPVACNRTAATTTLPVTLNLLGTFSPADSTTTVANIFDQGAAEIVSYDPSTEQLFVVNGAAGTIDVLDISNPKNPVKAFDIDLSPYGKQANSVAFSNGMIVSAVENVNKQANGEAVFFNAKNGNYIGQVTVGALPDMVTFTPNGDWVLVANEGEPNDDYTVDPEGTVSIIDVSNGVTNAKVSIVNFKAFNNTSLESSIRIFGPNATVAQDLEPEYITVSEDSKTAWVVMQENNAIAKIDIKNAKVESLIGLGFKDHNKTENALDASNKDGKINITNWPIQGMYQPDSIDAYTIANQTYLITANEGDSRDYDGFSEEARVKDLILDSSAFPNAADLQKEENLGRLKITTTKGDTDKDGDFDELFSYGARSFSIWTENGDLVFDSGDQIEQITATALPADFNSSDNENDSFDDRSDDKGPEPEGIVIGKISGIDYAFIGLERIGGIVVFNVSDPNDPKFVQYINTRDFDGNPEAGLAGDLSPEGLFFIPASDSPNGKPLLVVAYEVSGTTSIFEVN